MPKFIHFALICAVFAGYGLLDSRGAFASGASEWVVSDQTRIRLISEYDGVKGHDSLKIGLQVQLAPGWKIYWRNPGDAGIPPQFNWAGSTNLQTAEVHWPRPEEFDVFGLTTWGYHDEVVYPITVSLKDKGAPLDLKLDLFFGICEQVCIPYREELSLSLNSGQGAVSGEAGLIKEFVALVPPTIGSEGSQISSAEATALGNTDFTVQAVSTSSFQKPGVIVEGKDGTYFSPESATVSADGREVEFTISAELLKKTDRIAGEEILVTIYDEGFAAEGHLRVKQ
ncbi:MAG: protein-disulfide reductase DsbD family protein [Proteobacteria bacterium]|nr:protein-disulfide reductase DsbD family protein [Pseudomonadota bacterium]